MIGVVGGLIVVWRSATSNCAMVDTSRIISRYSDIAIWLLEGEGLDVASAIAF